MKKLIPTILILLISSVALSQSGWYEINSGVTANLNCVFFPSTSTGNIGYIAGDSGIILKTNNAGVNWFSVTADSNINFNTIHFINVLTGWAAGGSNISVLVYRTTDGGDNWVEQFNAYDGLCGVTTSFFTDENRGVIGGARRTLFSYSKGFQMRTTNGGVNWNKVNHNANIYSIYFTNPDSGWQGAFFDGSGTTYGQIQYTRNGGLNWNMKINYTGMHFFTVNFLNNNFGWAVGYEHDYNPVYTEIFRTTNGGYLWYSPVTIISTSIIFSVDFISTNKGWMCGTNGKIRHSDNGGNFWTVQNSGVTEDLKSITFTDALTGYAVGTNGTILKTITGGLTKVTNTQNNIPKDYNLYQNYPNPFNPITKIRFDIPRSSHIKLIIYDALGREVAELVNEKLSAGSYEVDWSGSGYPSGVYFYRLETNNFKETKRMLLIK